MRKWLWLPLLVLGAAVAQAPDPSQYGFSQATASLIVQPWDYMRLGLGSFVLTVPNGAFGSDPVRLEILTGDPISWQDHAPQGQKVLFAFALKVTDLKTGQPILAFAKPLHFSFYGTEIGPGSMYLNVTFTNPPAVTPNPVKPQIQLFRLGTRHQTGRLSHPIPGASVGWLVTAPKP